jgi:cytochrome c peroxidase
MRPMCLLYIAACLLLGCTANDDLNSNAQGQICTTDSDVTVDDSRTDIARLSGDYNYEDPEFPAHFKANFVGGLPVLEQDNVPENNPITNAGATLGRVLFYDVNLSANGTTSCASCHKSEFGFSDDRKLSRGFEGEETERHAMALTNARFYTPGMFFWDHRAATLEEQVLMPFQDPIEMGMTLDTLIAAVKAQGYYPPLFGKAFGDCDVTTERIALALAQFVRSLVSYRSPYDIGRAQVTSAKDDFPNFTEEENLGKLIFMSSPNTPNGGGCVVCHQGEVMSASDANNNGLDADWEQDAGVGSITGRSEDMGMFKVPSLRNVAVRARFMHDGRFSTLREVIDHYGDGVQFNPNLGVPLSKHLLNLSETDRQALVAFLQTLTDDEMLNDPKFANPFQ